MLESDFRTLLSLKADEEIVQELIVDGQCSCIDREEHFTLRRRVAEEYGLNPRSVVVVGSAKLGFSISPTKAYRAFGDHSDIDVAIVSSELFDRVWLEAFRFRSSGTYWPESDYFFKKLSSGWIRPDLMPRNLAFPIRSRWFDFFSGVRVRTTHGEMSPKAGLYKDWLFLEQYHRNSVTKLRTI